MKTYSTLLRGLLAVVLCASTGLAMADAVPAGGTYHVVIDTTGMSGTGWLDMAFLPGELPATAASATLSHISGAFGADFTLDGDVSGSLAHTLQFGNSASYNDAFQSLTLGGKFSFDVSFGGAINVVPGNVGTSFGVGLLGADQVSYLGNADGNLFQMDLTPASNAAATVGITVFAGNMVNVSAVPEPAPYLMLLGGVGMLGLLRRRSLA